MLCRCTQYLRIDEKALSIVGRPPSFDCTFPIWAVLATGDNSVFISGGRGFQRD